MASNCRWRHNCDPTGRRAVQPRTSATRQTRRGIAEGAVMHRFKLWHTVMLTAALACGAVYGSEVGQALLDKATDTKVAAENLADLNKVIELCQDAIKAGLDEGDAKFANGLLASTLTQRAELVCNELFERPVGPNRARKLVQMALADLEQTLGIDAEQGEAQYLVGRLYAH